MTDTAAATHAQIEALIMRAMRPSRMEHLELAKLAVEMRDMLSHLQTERTAMLEALEAVSGWMSMLHFIGDLTDVGEGHRAAVSAAIAQARGGEVQG